RPHNVELALDIKKGLHPKIAEDTPQCFVELIKRCLDVDPRRRPSAEDLMNKIFGWEFEYLYNYDDVESDIYQQFSKANQSVLNVERKPITELHPEAIYTSRPSNDIIEAINSHLNSGLEISD
ncbi:1224_t:CDS:2, partial [Cetraspora pellucida]